MDLPFEPTLNFIGLGVTAVDDPGNNRINITIPGFLAHDLLDNLQNQDTVAGVAVQGALIKGNAGGDWERFLKGTSLQQIRVNAGGTDLEYFTPTPFPTLFNQTIQDEGTSLTQRPTFNFIGTLVSAVDNPGSNRTDITVLSPTLFNQTIQDEGIALTQRPTFNFIGAGVTAVDNAGSSRTDITIPGGGTGWELVGTLDLGVNGDTMAVTITTPKRHLYVVFCAEAVGGDINTILRINNNSGSNYTYYRQQNAGAWSTVTSDTEMEMDPGSVSHREMVILEINDEPNHTKHFFSREIHSEDPSPAVAVERRQLDGMYGVSGARITTLNFINNGAGSYLAGASFIRVWGFD